MPRKSAGMLPCAELLSVAVHELRSPLAVVSGYLQMLSRGDLGPLSVRQQTTIQDLTQASARLLALVNALRDLANLQAGSFVLHRREAQLGGILEDAVRRAGQHLERELAPAIPAGLASASLLADSTRLAGALASVFAGVLRAGEPSESLAILPSAGTNRCVAFAVGTEAAARAIKRTGPARLVAFAPEGGGRALEALVARAVIEAHRGRIFAARGEQQPQAVVIELPRLARRAAR